MSLLRLAVSLLVLDTLTTAWLLDRRRRRRRVVRVVPVPMIGAKDPTLALRPANQELMRRQALLRTPDVRLGACWIPRPSYDWLPIAWRPSTSSSTTRRSGSDAACDGGQGSRAYVGGTWRRAQNGDIGQRCSRS